MGIFPLELMRVNRVYLIYLNTYPRCFGQYLPEYKCTLNCNNWYINLKWTHLYTGGGFHCMLSVAIPRNLVKLVQFISLIQLFY